MTEQAERWEAKRDARVNDPATGLDRWVLAGQPIPAELVEHVSASNRRKIAEATPSRSERGVA